MAQDPNKPSGNDPKQEGDVEILERRKTKRPRRYAVLFHNDDYTTMEFVVHVLMKFFAKSETEATHIMLNVHRRGYAAAGAYTRDVAETKVSQVTEYARANGHPLKVTSEPEDDEE